jgi:PAS domain S-box-containing protein
MSFRDTPIRRKLMTILLVTSGAVVVLTCTALFAYEFLTFRQTTVRQLSTLGEVIASNSTAALAFENQADATEILNAIKAERHIVAAVLYDKDGKFFAKYPTTLAATELPATLAADGHRFTASSLAVVQPVMLGGKRLGTLYLKSDMGAMSERFRLYGGIVVLVMAASFLVAYVLSHFLQRQITRPLLRLAESARIVSERRDYSLRAQKEGSDEIGRLTDAFNEMLAQVQEQDRLRARLAAIVEWSNDAIIGESLEGIITSWNPGAEKIFGYSANEIIGQSMELIVPPDRRDEIYKLLARIARGDSVEHFETARVRKGGTRVDISATISPIKDAQGRVVGASKIARDITEHKLEQVRLQFRALFESLPGLFLVLTPDLEIVAASDAYLKATMTTREGITGRGLFEVLPANPDDPAATGVSNLRASLERVRQTLQVDPMAIQKYDVRRPDGTFEERFWSPVNSPMLGTDQRLAYIIHRIEDVTEFVRTKTSAADRAAGESGLRARMEQMEAEIFRSSQEVQGANAQLRAANAELEAFSYSVSHDLRAPLRHVDGFANMLRGHASKMLDDKGRRYLDTISDAAKRMGRLIDDLLQFSRYGRAEMHHTAIDLSALVTEVRLRLQGENAGRTIVWTVEELPVVSGDLAMLRQVFENLLSNAVKYTRQRAEARITIGVQPGAPGFVTVFIRDNGAGFDMKYADKLFGVFQRLHTAHEFEGTGVGLANVQRIVQRHGGRAWAEAVVDEGATFYFTLPISGSSVKATSTQTADTS